jgi:hypothetical protein
MSAEFLKQLKMVKRFSCPECPMKSRFKVNISRHLSKLHPGSKAKVVMADRTVVKADAVKVQPQKSSEETKTNILNKPPIQKKVKKVEVRHPTENRNDARGQCYKTFSPVSYKFS